MDRQQSTGRAGYLTEVAPLPSWSDDRSMRVVTKLVDRATRAPLLATPQSEWVRVDASRCADITVVAAAVTHQVHAPNRHLALAVRGCAPWRWRAAAELGR